MDRFKLCFGTGSSWISTRAFRIFRNYWKRCNLRRAMVVLLEEKSFGPNVIYYVSTLIEIRQATGPWRVRSRNSIISSDNWPLRAKMGRPGDTVPAPTIPLSQQRASKAVLGAIFMIFWRRKKTSENQWCFESAKNHENCRINRPWGVQR